MSEHNHNLQEVEKFVQWRKNLYYCLGIGKDAQLDLLDALSSNREAKTVVELSLNPLFKRKYHSIYRAIKSVNKPQKESKNNENNEDKEENKDELLIVLLETIPPNNKREYHLFGIDTTPNPRQFAPTLTDKKVVYQPNSIQGNKPINVGHSYSWLCYLPEKEPNFNAAWTIPLSVERVKSDDKDVNVANQQLKKILENSQHFANKLSLIVVDSLYSQRNFIGEQVKNKDRVVVTRVRSNRVFYRPFYLPEPSVSQSGHPRWYGDKFDLKDSDSWSSPDEVIHSHFTTSRGKLLNLTIQGWKNMLMRGTKAYKLHNYPFTLLQITLTDQEGNLVGKPMWLIAIGDRRNELSLLDIYQSYRQRYDLEHFFRFGKQRLLMNSFLTPDTEQEENWVNLTLIAYVNLWAARNLADCFPRDWEKYLPSFKAHNITPSVVQRDFFRIISTLGISAVSPKPRGFSSGRKKGEIQVKRPQHQVIKKGKKCQPSPSI